MTNFSPAEKYAASLVERLEVLYDAYTAELKIMEKGLKESTAEILDNFVNIEHHRFQNISSAEKVLQTHLSGCSSLFQSEAFGRLHPRRNSALRQSRVIRSVLKEHMIRLRTEIGSFRRTGMARNYKRESVPVLIDIMK